jgi:hypothetical protein
VLKKLHILIEQQRCTYIGQWAPCGQVVDGPILEGLDESVNELAATKLNTVYGYNALHVVSRSHDKFVYLAFETSMGGHGANMHLLYEYIIIITLYMV